MVTAEEKRKFIDDVIEYAYHMESSSEVLRKLNNIFFRDTNEGKLYKYRSFDKEGYSLKNLQDGTLHCSKPAAFNDPFDCKIGIDFQSLCEAKYSAEFELVDRCLEKAVKCVRNESAIEECSIEEQAYIKKILDNKTLNDFINYVVTQKETDEEFLVENNTMVIYEMLKTILFRDAFKEINEIYGDSLIRIVKEDVLSPEILRLFLNKSAKFEDYARAKGIMDDEDEMGLSLLLGNKLFPEQSETITEAISLIDNVTLALQEKINSMFLVGCLSNSYKNRLMWSHYADCHRGFCIEYDFNGIEDESQSRLVLPVVYSENRPLLPWKAAIDGPPQNIKETTGDLIKAMMTKDKIWEYENEWRIIIGAMCDSEVVMPPISCIYLGEAIEDENRDKIHKIAQKHNIPVKQMKLDRGTYDLHAELIYTK